MRSEPSPASAQKLTSVANALQVIALAHEEGTVNLTSISARLGVGKSTAHRLVTTLAAENFLQRSHVAHAEFILGPILLEIGAAAIRQSDVLRHARRPMERLSDRVSETVSLVILQGSTTRVVDSIESRQTVRVGLRTGVVVPANLTAAGKVLLAQIPEEGLRALFRQALPSLTSAKGDWSELDRELAQVRLDGFAFSAGESDPAIHGLAVPVRDRTGVVVAALAMAAPFYRLQPQTARVRASILRDSAEEITKALQ